MSAYHDDDSGSCPDCGMPFLDCDCPFDDPDPPMAVRLERETQLRLTDPDEDYGPPWALTEEADDDLR